MSGLNSILSFFSPHGVTAAAGRPSFVPVRPEPVRAGEQDVFEPGQWWKNRGAARPESTGFQKSGRNFQVARAYALQAGRAPSEPNRAVDTSPDHSEDGDSSAASSDPAAARPSGAVGSGERAGRGDQAVGPRKPDGTALSRAELQTLQALQHADTAVRAHEMAHLAVAGPYAASGMHFQYQRGPDGKNYAVAGEVKIDTSREASPEATIAKMKVVRAAALAPADPSPQDRKVAASATVAISAATREMRMVRLEEARQAAERSGGRAGNVAGGPVRSTGGGTPPAGTATGIAAYATPRVSGNAQPKDLLNIMV